MSRASDSRSRAGLERDAEPLRPVLVDQHHVGRVLEVPARDVPGPAAVREVGRVRVRVVGAGRGGRGLGRLLVVERLRLRLVVLRVCVEERRSHLAAAASASWREACNGAIP